MTREQYESFNNMQFLTDEEKDNQKELNIKNNYGLSYNQIFTLTHKHKVARKSEDYRTMAKIEYRLTDINFHSECEMLYKGKYKELINTMKED